MDLNVLLAHELVRLHQKDLFDAAAQARTANGPKRRWWRRDQPARRKVSYRAGTLVACAPAVVE